jgi:L-threonylcarbamoyladenylate synthase
MRIAGIEEAARIMRRGGVVAYPAEACFGLGCDPRDRRAAYRILALKGRALNQGLILVGASLYQLKPWLDPAAESLLEGPRRTWPGPVTWVLPAARWAPPWITGHRRSIAVRVTAMPAMARLCRSFGGAIVSTSANPRGMPPARTAAQVGTYFGRRLDAVVRGTTGGLANPTEIRDAAGAVIRPG